MQCELCPADVSMIESEGIWQAANEAFCGSHPLLDTKFVLPLIDVFGRKREQLAILRDGGRTVGVALLEKKSTGAWELFLPEQAPLGPLILRAGNVDDYLSSILKALPGRVMLLSLPKQDPSFLGSADVDHCEQISYGTTIKIDVRGSFADYWGKRHKNVRRNIKRLYAKLESERIVPTLVRHDTKSAMAEAVSEHGRLETSGWKSGHGTAIHADNVQGRFYSNVLENFAEHGGAQVYQLKFGEQLVASQLGIAQNGMLVLLKTAYDESFSGFAPGRILDHMMIKRIFDGGGVRTIEYYTSATKEDRKWCTSQRDIFHLNYFRSGVIRRLATATRRIRLVYRTGHSGAWAGAAATLSGY